jgi:SAM-dependent methyltransferase
MKSAIKRVLGLDEARPRVVRPAREQAAELWSWLADFSPPTVSALRALMVDQGSGVAAVLAGPALAHFKLDPRASIDQLRATLAAIHADDGASVVVWCLDQYQTHGLEPDEAEALFGAWLAIESMVRVEPSTDWKKLLIVTRPRVEEIGVAFELDCASGAGLSSLLGLELLQAPTTTARASVVFVDVRTAAGLVRRPEQTIVRSLRAGARGGAFAIGAIIRGERLADAETLERELAPLRTLAAGTPIEYVRVRPPQAIVERPARLSVLREAGLRYDCSFVDAAELGAASFFRAGAYWPQPFDARTPAGVQHAGLPVEIVATDASARSARDAWRRRADLDRGRVEPLLTFSRAEAFHRDLEPQVRYAQRYHEYRVFNWPTPDGVRRTTMIDAGPIGPLSVWRVQRFARWLSKRAHPMTVRFPGPAIGASAEAEASSRLLSADDAIRHQTVSHEYLETTARDGRLRADYQRFAELMPARLGDVLELGAGYGQLAAALAPKSTRYVCVELDAAVLRDVRARAGLPGVAADIHRLPFRDASFETVVANNVIEHAFDPLRALGEIRRVLRPAGRFLALLPLDALNPAFQLRTHWWKADETNIAHALAMAELRPSRMTRLNLYELGVYGAFPSCNGWSCAIEAMRSEAVS